MSDSNGSTAAPESALKLLESIGAGDVTAVQRSVLAGGKAALSGRATLFGVRDMPVTICLSDIDGSATSLWFEVSPEDWCRQFEVFSQIPWVAGWNNPYGPVFDELPFERAYLVISAGKQLLKDGLIADLQLEDGLNLVGILNLPGWMATVASALSFDTRRTISGPIRFPKSLSSQAQLPLKTGEYPWQRAVPSEGITLNATLIKSWKFETFEFGEVGLHAYSPLSYDWLTVNPQFLPVLGITWELTIPKPAGSAAEDIRLHFLAESGIEPEKLTLACTTKGVSIKNLSEIAGLSGNPNQNLRKVLPEILRNAIAELKLRQVEIDLDFSAKIPKLSRVWFKVGYDELNWKWFDGKFEVCDISATFGVHNPFESGRRSWEIGAEAKLKVLGTSANVVGVYSKDLFLRAEIEENLTIKPAKFLEEFGIPDVPIGDLSISRLAVTLVPSKAYSFALSVSDWKFMIGPKEVCLSNLNLDLWHRAATEGVAASTQAKLSGVLKIADVAEVAARWEIPGELEIRAEFPQIRLKELVGTFGLNLDSYVPDLTFVNSLVLIRKAGENYSLLLSTNVTGWGAVALQIGSFGGTLAAAAGIALDVDNLKKQDTIGKVIHEFMTTCGLSGLCMVISTRVLSDFEFPKSPALKPLAVTPRKGAPQGLSVQARWNLQQKQENEFLEILRKALDLNLVLDAELLLSSNEQRLIASCKGKIKGIDVAGEIGLLKNSGGFSIYLKAVATGITICDTDAAFELAAAAGTQGLSIYGSLRATSGLPAAGKKALVNGGIQLLGPLVLGELKAGFSVSREGAITVGFSASISVGKFNAFAALFYDSVKQAVSLVAAMDDLSLGDVLRALDVGSSLWAAADTIAIRGVPRGNGARTLTGEPGREEVISIVRDVLKSPYPVPGSADQIVTTRRLDGTWSVLDAANLLNYSLEFKNGKTYELKAKAQLKVLTSDVTIGDTTIKKGLTLIASIQFLSWNAFIDVSISEEGILAKAEMDAIVFSPMPALFSITEFVDTTKQSPVTQESGKSTPVTQVTSAESVKKRGPQLSVSTFQPNPHLYINGQFRFLGMTAGVYCYIDKEKLDFQAKFEILIIKIELAIKYYKSSGFSANGKIIITIPPITIGTETFVVGGAYAEVNIEIAGPNTAFSAFLIIRAELFGRSLTIADLSVDLSYGQFANMSKMLKNSVIDGCLAHLGLGEVKSLEEKTRWSRIEVANETRFSFITVEGDAFDSGKYWQEPTDIPMFARGVFAVSNRANSIMTGVSGTTAYKIQSGTHESPVTEMSLVIAFSDAFISSLTSLLNGDLRSPKCMGRFLPPGPGVQALPAFRQQVWDQLGEMHTRPSGFASYDNRLEVLSYPGANGRVIIRERDGFTAASMVGCANGANSDLFVLTAAGTIYCRHRQGGVWKAWRLPEGAVNSYLAIAAGYHRGDQRTGLGIAKDSVNGCLFGIGYDGFLYRYAFDGHGNMNVGALLTGNGLPKTLSGIAAARTASGDLLVFATAVGPNTKKETPAAPVERTAEIYFNYMNEAGNFTSAWRMVKAPSHGKPIAVNLGDYVALFLVGENGRLYSNAFTRATTDVTMNVWSPYFEFLTAEPIYHRNQLHVVGLDKAYRIWHHKTNNPVSSLWSRLDMSSFADPSLRGQNVKSITVATSPDNNLEVFATLDDGTLCHTWSKDDGATWSAWTANFQKAPKLRNVFAAPGRDNSLDIFGVRLEDQRIFHNGFVKGQGWFGSWQNLSINTENRFRFDGEEFTGSSVASVRRFYLNRLRIAIPAPPGGDPEGAADYGIPGYALAGMARLDGTAAVQPYDLVVFDRNQGIGSMQQRGHVGIVRSIGKSGRVVTMVDSDWVASSSGASHEVDLAAFRILCIYRPTFALEARYPPLPSQPGDADVSYQAHLQLLGDSEFAFRGEILGTTGKALRLENIRIVAPGREIRYQVHVQQEGWKDIVKDGAVAGWTDYSGRRVESIRIWVDRGRVVYWVHQENNGWWGPFTNGHEAGVVHKSLRLEAIAIHVYD